MRFRAPPSLELGGIPVTIQVSSRARRLRLKVDPRTRAVVLTVPQRISPRRALAWAAEHRAWVEATLAKLPERQPIEPDVSIPLFGRPLRIDWDAARPRRVELYEDRLITGGPVEGLEMRVLRWLKGEANSLLERETRELAVRAGVAVNRIGVGDPVSRWGSCSSSGTIRYSWRLIMAPDFVRRATVAHEVAHLVHMNHGPAFHALVDDLLGENAKPARLWLRREGPGLHRIGRAKLAA
ncbi:MAG: M48 family metallopeptidase [Allosphingosinicella sp.]